MGTYSYYTHTVYISYVHLLTCINIVALASFISHVSDDVVPWHTLSRQTKNEKIEKTFAQLWWHYDPRVNLNHSVSKVTMQRDIIDLDLVFTRTNIFLQISQIKNESIVKVHSPSVLGSDVAAIERRARVNIFVANRSVFHTQSVRTLSCNENTNET